MKKLAIALASIFATAAAIAYAAYDRNGNYYESYQPGANDSRAMSRSERLEYGRVIDSRPVYESENRKEECWNPRAGHYEERRDTHDSNVKGTVAGAVIGGVVGHQVDSGVGGTLGGALIGGIIGNQVDKSHNSNPQNDLDFSRCRVIGGSTGHVLGYDVRYEYRGREYSARLDHEPPKRLRVGTDIRDDGQPF
jgi:uncharacterized protein YcfJ